MQPPKKYSVVLVDLDGERTLYPMKENGAGQTPSEAPPIDPNTDSQQLRRAFTRMGWVTEDTGTQVLVPHPGTPKTEPEPIQSGVGALLAVCCHQSVYDRRKVVFNYSLRDT